jgi:hypothetical protein
MSIWGNRNKEPAAEDAPAEATPAAAPPENNPAVPQSGAQAGAVPQSGAPSGTAPEGEPPTGEPAPAFWRAQGRPLPPGHGRAPARAGGPEPSHAGVPSAAPVGETPPVSEAQARTDASAPVPAEDVMVIDAEAAVKDPALTGTAREPAETAGQPVATARRRDRKVAQVPGEPAVTPDSPGSISPQRWSEILVAFVDDPPGSVKMAADAVDQAIEEVVSSVRAQQRALASSWQGTEADTEQLRTVLREYRRFGAQVREMSPAKPAARGTAAAS